MKLRNAVTVTRHSRYVTTQHWTRRTPKIVNITLLTTATRVKSRRGVPLGF